jgi:hypothetical protein
MKLKGFTQLNSTKEGYNLESEAYILYSWYDDESDPNLKVRDKLLPDLESSRWEKPEVPGRRHRAYNNFYIWFEYE